MKRILAAVIFFTTLFVFLSQSLYSIPAFARKHRLSCKTCHNPFPRLKPYGEEFAANGFVLKDKPSSRYYLDTGDDKLSLLRSFPFAIRMDGFVSYNNADQEISDFKSPYNIKLLSGGALAKNISYYFYFFFSERGEIVGLEDAFLMFSDIFKTGISLTVGQFQISDPLFKRELRLTFEDYYIYKAKPGGSHLDLTYDRGLMLNYTIPGGPDIAVQVLNGTGIDAANVFKDFDNDKYKNLFGRISQDFGEHIRIGAFGFTGKEETDDLLNNVTMWGVDATFAVGDFELNGQYMEREDDNPIFMDGWNLDIQTKGAFAELIFTPNGDSGPWYAVALYNWVDSDIAVLNYESAALHIGYLLRRNIRLMTEVNFIGKSEYGKYTRVLAGIIAAF